jgi:UDP-N-acetylglucosamine--N-acetylmuramyl-(pentapeptide) pyrophosphoryl-undecaprenol N-acetylglucosamine transferase
MNASSPLIILAAGGTGGHIFPAEALARALVAHGCRVCLFTDPRGGKFSGELQDVPVVRIFASSLGKSFFSKTKGAIKMGIGTLQAFLKLRAMKPALVVGFGGYPSVPTVFAASKLGIPVMLHEQNAVIGRANRVLAPLAKVVATSFPHVAGMVGRAAVKTVLTGTPVRPAICALHDIPYPAANEASPIKLLVVGGSLGAQVFSTVVPKAISLLPDTLRKRISISQQCRAPDIDAVRQAYTTMGMSADLATFFRDIPERLSQCHLVICRSGASTVAELCAAARPAILVPYPYAIADEQKANAQSMAEAGAGWLIPESALTPEALALRLESLISQPLTLSKAADAARGLARLNAAEHLAELALGLIDISHDHSDNGANPPQSGSNVSAHAA